MAIGSCYTVVKYLLFVFSFVLWLLGCGHIGVGIWLFIDKDALDFSSHTSELDSLQLPAYSIIGLGCVIMLIGFLGCCGAFRESQCLLGALFVALFVVFAGLLGLAIWVVVARGSFEDVVEDWLDSGVENYDTNEFQKSFMDTVQTNFHCCGSAKGEVDYVNVGSVPKSCEKDNYRKPCLAALSSWWEDKFIVIAGECVGVAVVLVIGMVLSMVLCCAIRNTLL